MTSYADMPIGNKLLVEVGWEACWQLGGIYTVLRSKAPVTVQRWGERYCQLGPYHHPTASVEYEELPMEGVFGRTVELLRQRGIVAYYGRRLITGKPQAVLIDFTQSLRKLSEYQYYFWKDHGIETLDEPEVNDVILFGYLAAEFFQALTDVLRDDNDSYGSTFELPIVGHFHEWMAGVPLPEIHRRKLPVATVFTTHATLLGRYLASDDPNFYETLPTINSVEAARSKFILPRYSIEKIAAQSADVFTTVSSITGYEAEHFLERKPDLLLPNGINIQRFAALHEFQNLHAKFKKKINEFVVGHFFPSYSFDLDRTLYIFTSGRYEYTNKGFDMFIEALARLNWQLKCRRSDITVVAFIVTKGATRGFNMDALKSQLSLRDLRNTITTISDEIGEKLFMSAATGVVPTIEDLLDEYAQVRIKRMAQAWRRRMPPAICTHDMTDDPSDPILRKLRLCQLLNNSEDRVKVIFHPEFLSGTSPVIGLDYGDFVRGCHLGVFPSYYEPWGYTPMECTALGIPAITSDLAGFGAYVQEKIPDHADRGLQIVERRFKNFDESTNQMVDFLSRTLLQDRRSRIDQRNRAEAASVLFDWNILARSYWDAHALALMRHELE